MRDPDAMEADRGLGAIGEAAPQHNPVKIKSHCYHALLQWK